MSFVVLLLKLNSFHLDHNSRFIEITQPVLWLQKLVTVTTGRNPTVRAAVLWLQPRGQSGVPALPAGGVARGRQQSGHQARTHQHGDRWQSEVISPS